jgi:hypothetical protein
LFIDCGKDNPEEFIGFRGEFAYAIDDNQRGQITITYLKLNATDRGLLEARLQRLRDLITLNQIVKLAFRDPNNHPLQEVAKEAKDVLEKAILDSAEFAAVTRCAIDSDFQYAIN